MLFQYLRKTSMLRIAPKYSSNYIKCKPFHTATTGLRADTKNSTDTGTDTTCGLDDFSPDEFYGNKDALWAAVEVLGEADLAGKKTIEMDKQILREILWEIDEDWGLGYGTLRYYLDRKNKGWASALKHK